MALRKSYGSLVHCVHIWPRLQTKPISSPRVRRLLRMERRIGGGTTRCMQWASLSGFQVHDDANKGKLFPRYWPFLRGIYRPPVNFPHKGQWLGALMFSFICAWINGWVSNREAGDLRRHRAHYDVTVMLLNDVLPFTMLSWTYICRLWPITWLLIYWQFLPVVEHGLLYVTSSTTGKDLSQSFRDNHHKTSYWRSNHGQFAVSLNINYISSLCTTSSKLLSI